MNIIFLTMAQMDDVETHGIYSDLMRKFRNEGHEVYIVTPRERRMGKKTCLYEARGVHFLAVKTLNLQKTNVIEKKGLKIGDMDMFIAATALEEDLIIVTGNTDHFSRIEGLKIENWMER